MRTQVLFYISICVIMVFASCNDGKKQAIATVDAFLKAASSPSSTNKPEKYYPHYDSYGIITKSDVVNFDENVQNNGDTIIVKCVNNYTSENGVFRQDSLTFYLLKDEKTEKYQIINSIGLLKLSAWLKDFASRMGIYINKNTRDLKISLLGVGLASFCVSKFLDEETGHFREDTEVAYTREEFFEYQKSLNSLGKFLEAINKIYPYRYIIYDNKMKW